MHFDTWWHCTWVGGPLISWKWTLSLRCREERLLRKLQAKDRNPTKICSLELSKDLKRAHWPPLTSYWRFQEKKSLPDCKSLERCFLGMRMWSCWWGRAGGTWNSASESQQLRAGRIHGEGRESGVQPPKTTVEERANGMPSDLMRMPQCFSSIRESSTFLPLCFNDKW